MRLSYVRRGKERWLIELARSLNPEDEMLIALSASAELELAPSCDCADGSCSAQHKPRFGFSR